MAEALIAPVWTDVAAFAATPTPSPGPTVTASTIYYIGPFSGSTALDDSDCGTGTGTHPAAHPCTTLAFWNQSRRPTALSGCSAASPCVVRFAPGTYSTATASAYHCVVAQSNVTYEGRLADDSSLPPGFGSVTIDTANTVPSPSNPPCRGRSLTPLNSSATYPDTTVAPVTNFTLRYLTLANAPTQASEYRAAAALYGGIGTTTLVIDHVRVTGNKSGGLMIGEENWRANQCSTSKGFCSESIVGAACSGGAGTCTQGLDWDCTTTLRRTTNVTVQDSQFDGNATDPTASPAGGLQVGCVDGFTLLRNVAFGNHQPGQSCCGSGSDAPGCDGINGLHVYGGIHGNIDTFESYGNGEGDIEFGNSYNYSDHDFTAVRLFWHDDVCQGGRAGLKLVGGYNQIIRNSMGYGGYSHVVEQYNCSHHITFENNTIWSSIAGGWAFNIRDNNLDWAVRNNIFRGSFSGTGTVGVGLRGIADANTAWDHNVIVNADAAGYAVETLVTTARCSCTVATQIADCGTGGICSQGVCTAGSASQTSCTSDASCNVGSGRVCLGADGPCYPLKIHGVYPLNNWVPPVPAGTACGTAHTCVDDTASGLATFQGASNRWFGGSKGVGEKWGVAPSMVNPATPSPASLSLLSSDTVAKGAALSLWSPQFNSDYFWNSRPQTGLWDIGAHQVGTSPAPTPTLAPPPPAPVLFSVEVVP